jgi:hypothetical protein
VNGTIRRPRATRKGGCNEWGAAGARERSSCEQPTPSPRVHLRQVTPSTHRYGFCMCFSDISGSLRSGSGDVGSPSNPTAAPPLDMSGQSPPCGRAPWLDVRPLSNGQTHPLTSTGALRLVSIPHWCGRPQALTESAPRLERCLYSALSARPMRVSRESSSTRRARPALTLQPFGPAADAL